MNAKSSVIHPTPQTGQALRKVFSLLENFFDVEAGTYREDYNDDRVAKETGISLEAVKNYRVAAFGKIKPPTELYGIQTQLRELENLYLKTEQDMKAAIKDLKTRLQSIQRRFD